MNSKAKYYDFTRVAGEKIKPKNRDWFGGILNSLPFYNYSKISLEKFQNQKLPWYERYEDLLPYKNHKILKSLGEGNTPILKSKKYDNLFYKDEGRNPSGSFKDREASTIIPFYSAQGYKKFALASSGNAALSASLYGSIYGVEVTCFVPKNASSTKKDLIKTFGGKIHEVGNQYEACHKALADSKNFKDSINITAGINPFKDQGDKVISYETYEQMGVPDVVVIPSANGCLLSGIHQGFLELIALGLTTKMPKFIGVQIKDADPIAIAMKKNLDSFSMESIHESLAEGLAAIESYCSPKAIHALRSTGGFVYSVSETSLIDAMKYAITVEGIVPEWTSASVFAAITGLYEKGLLSEKETVLVVNTGSGMKEISDIAKKLSGR